MNQVDKAVCIKALQCDYEKGPNKWKNYKRKKTNITEIQNNLIIALADSPVPQLYPEVFIRTVRGLIAGELNDSIKKILENIE